METAPKTIGPLDKVGLKISVSSPPGVSDAKTNEVETSVIYGIGVEGVTPFEKMIFGKCLDDQLDIPIANGCRQTIFGHLSQSLFHQINIAPPFHLKITIVAIERAESREVIQTMARMAEGCGGECDCGCGCS